ncbi:MAG: hypothetical protein ABJA67_12720 [Chthonomonadales bacterium]
MAFDFMKWIKDRAFHLPAASNSLEDLVGKDTADLLKTKLRTDVLAAIGGIFTTGEKDVAILTSKAMDAISAGLSHAMNQETAKLIAAAIGTSVAGSINGTVTNVEALIASQVLHVLKLS